MQTKYEKILKKPAELTVGDVINTCFGYTITILEFVEIECVPFSNQKNYVYQICNNFTENRYYHRFDPHMPYIVIDQITEAEVQEILATKAFKDYESKRKDIKRRR